MSIVPEETSSETADSEKGDPEGEEEKEKRRRRRRRTMRGTKHLKQLRRENLKTASMYHLHQTLSLQIRYTPQRSVWPLMIQVRG